MHSSANSTTAIRQSAGEKAILKAAVRLFSDKGYDGVSMRSVAEAAGVSKANIYHHFESKEALYLAILRASAAELSALVENLAEGPGAFDLRIAGFAIAHLEHLSNNTLTSRLMFREAFSGDEERSRMMVDQVVGGIFQRIVRIFQAGQEEGVLRSDLGPALCASLLMGADVFFFQARDVMKHIPQAGFAQQPARFSKQMIDVMLNGMLSPEQKRGASA